MNIIKRIIVSVMSGSLILFSVQYAWAIEPGLGTNAMQKVERAGSNSALMQPNPTKVAKIEGNLQERASKEIQRRITALQGLLKIVSNAKRLNATQKASYTTAINTEISSLQALLTKIQADTDPVTLKTDVQSIISGYRIFALFMPQMRLLGAADMVLNAADKLSSLSGTLQTEITVAQQQGIEVTAMQTSLADMNSKINDAKTQGNAIITAVAPLTPAGYPGNKSILMTAKTNLETAIQDLKTANQDARSIIQSLKNVSSSTVPSSPSAVVKPNAY